jgi:Zn-dependent peptidase ImmA (M78 family)/transcriptional regulator with XRE-family HTH domain
MVSVNRDMLTLARESRHKTQTSLAEDIGVAHSTISKAESGAVEPGDDLVAGYVKHLRYPVEFFLAKAPDARLPVPFYRKKKSKVGPSELRTIEAQMRILCMHVDRLLRSVEAPPLRIPHVDLAKESARSASDVAHDLRLAWNVSHGPIDSMTALIEANGCFVIPWHFDVPGVDALSMHPDGLPPVIMIDPSMPGDRMRFTLAHELAHVILHHGVLFPAGDVEEEADAFAAEFLMPRDEIRPFLSGLTLERAAQLKMRWRTSIASIIVRASDLEAIKEPVEKRLWAKMGALGFMRSEPIDVAREKPRMAKNLVAFHMKSLGYDAKEMSRMLPWGEDEFARTYLDDARRPALRVVTF